jgi:hypothetical protein
MRAQEILTILRKRPFAPLRVYLSDGAYYDVTHPDMVVVSVREVVIGIGANGAVAQKLAYCDPLHITRIEPAPGKRPGIAPKRKKR